MSQASLRPLLQAMFVCRLYNSGAEVDLGCEIWERECARALTCNWSRRCTGHISLKQLELP